MTPIPLDPEDPKNPGYLEKSDNYSIIWSWSYVQEIQFSVSFSWDKLATIYIKVRAEERRRSEGLPPATSLEPFIRCAATKILVASLLDSLFELSQSG